jgi:UDP-glucuronate 4-epimerase
MTILVTGAAGFIGSHLAEAPAAPRHTVIGLDASANYYDPAQTGQ